MTSRMRRTKMFSKLALLDHVRSPRLLRRCLGHATLQSRLMRISRQGKHPPAAPDGVALLAASLSAWMDRNTHVPHSPLAPHRHPPRRYHGEASSIRRIGLNRKA